MEWNRSINKLFSGAILMAVCFSCKPSTNKQEHITKPNVVVIFTDDMNFEDIGALGGKVLTPTIDSLMHDGVLFSNFYDCSAVCSPSRYNLLTGRYASRSQSLLHQFPTSDPAFLRWNVEIDKGERTMAHVLKENGYQTGFVGKYHNLQNEHLQDQIPGDSDMNDPAIQERIAANYLMFKNLVKKTSGFDYVENIYVNNLHALALPKTMQHHNMDWITAGGLDFLDQVGDNPFFLYFATTLPHKPAPIQSMYADSRITPFGLLDKGPQVQPDRMEVIERVKNAGLPEEAAPYTWLDDAVGALIRKLDSKGVLDNTVIFFASDHGGNNAKMTCYEKGVRAPAFAYWKGKFKPGYVINYITANIDIAPTIYDLCGVEDTGIEVIDGRSIKPLLFEKKTDWRQSLMLEITYSKGIVTDEWKYIAVRFPQEIQDNIQSDPDNDYNHEGTLFSANNPDGQQKVRYKADEIYPSYFSKDQLFNLKNDKEEQQNLAYDPAYKDDLIRMQNLLKSYVNEFPHAFGEFTTRDGGKGQ